MESVHFYIAIFFFLLLIKSRSFVLWSPPIRDTGCAVYKNPSGMTVRERKGWKVGNEAQDWGKDRHLPDRHLRLCCSGFSMRNY